MQSQVDLILTFSQFYFISHEREICLRVTYKFHHEGQITFDTTGTNFDPRAIFPKQNLEDGRFCSVQSHLTLTLEKGRRFF